MDREEVYIYNGVDRVPRDVTHVRVDQSVTVIPDRAFNVRRQLVEVDLPEGLIRIGDNAFEGCKSLRSINFPSTLEEIGNQSFNGCKELIEVDLPERLLRLGIYAFMSCRTLKRINIPSTLARIEVGAFLGCFSLVNVILSEGIIVIGQEAFNGCKSLWSVKLPSSLKVIEVEAFRGCEVLRNVAFLSECRVPSKYMWEKCGDLNSVLPLTSTISDTLQHRFDNLPIHKICYYQSYHDTGTTMQHLKREINLIWSSTIPGQLNKTGKHQDCLGMTPLHILACSTKPTIEMYHLLIDKYPETLIMKDKWGDIPLLYAIWCNAPAEALDLLVESYKSMHPGYEFDWSGMIQTLAKRNVPLANIKKLINTQERNFPDQEYDIQPFVVVGLSASVIQRGGRTSGVLENGETFQYLLPISIRKRLDSLAVGKWSVELEDSVEILSRPWSSEERTTMNREKDTKALYQRLATYEIAKEGTSVLELALWKAKIDEGRNKTAEVDGEVSYSGQCRINCGADIVIRNVLPYLMPE